MYTYTTPTITCKLVGVDFENVDIVRVAFFGRGSMVVREVDATDIDTENGSLVVTLTQSETAALDSGKVTIQARIRYTDGTVQATNNVVRMMSDVLDRVVI